MENKLPEGWEWKKLGEIAEINPKFDQTAGGHPTLKDGVCFGPPARLLGDR
ncbi:hypothetical protein [Methanosarcina mazei]|uniref:Type I restriction-modification system, specificity subunit S n=1 Tax=Methanosarcina mazei WWM610 TaxID=1434117 RepID=A0A0E3PXI3_METMZ|nr:hypothetical protein [Methanosarcina mazei]AKB40487.1 Type I restriction-modification system, specificity subunit S [Methanosarcina mazei WWM610]